MFCQLFTNGGAAVIVILSSMKPLTLTCLLAASMAGHAADLPRSLRVMDPARQHDAHLPAPGRLPLLSVRVMKPAIALSLLCSRLMERRYLSTASRSRAEARCGWRASSST